MRILITFSRVKKNTDLELLMLKLNLTSLYAGRNFVFAVIT
jgi:hypothetical protein